ncbi:flagellar biosynthetic protein FliR [Paremcibacter congregatus]|uniref:flagellar biosynthetic protein FliR n=1 Tax=Paremcibacter congregatus TaxID=2043170 RepID=UPI003A8F8618
MLPAEVFAFFLVFARLGAMIMVLPALGETGIPQRIRLALALSISFVIYSLVRTKLPAIPDSAILLGILIVFEILIGVLIGTAIRLLMTAIHTAGTIIAMQTGLAMAQAFDPAQGAQSALMSTFLTLMAVVLIFITNLHHMMISAMYDSYTLFPVGSDLEISNFAELVVRTVANSFLLGVQIASPFIVYGLIFNIGLGILARLMPQLQVFFVAMPLNIMAGFIVLSIMLAAGMNWFLQHMEDSLGVFLNYGVG